MLGDTRQILRDWPADAARVLDVEGLPDDRAAAAAELDARGAYAVETGAGALERLGSEVIVVRSRDELIAPR